jgi:mitogen-activated protein kinase kinase
MERDNSMQGLLPDLEKLSLEKGRPLDVEDLDDAGWKVASKEGRIVELGSLGEGAGGAVTRCILKGGKTVFALKVSLGDISSPEDTPLTDNYLCRSSQPTQTQM